MTKAQQEKLIAELVEALKVAKKHQEGLGCQTCRSIRQINRVLKKAEKRR